MMKIGEILDKREQDLLSEARTPSQKEIETHALAMAKKYNVPFDIIMRHMWVESRYKTKARSSANAYGLMQLMPRTARGLGVNRDNWQENIEGGAKYLRNIKRRLNKKASRLGVKGFKNPWHLVAMRYYTGEARFSDLVFKRAQSQNKISSYVDENGMLDTVQYMRDQVKEHPKASRRKYLKGLLRYASAVHDPDNGIQKSRLRRHPSYRVAIPKEYISQQGATKFGLAPTGIDSKTIPSIDAAPKKPPTIIYIGDSTTGGMSRYMKKIFKKNGMDAHVFHVNGAGAALMHTMVTGRLNKWSSKYSKGKRDKAMAIAAKIDKLRSQGDVSIRISSLGGNDRFRISNKRAMDKYIKDYVVPLFKEVDEVGGSGRSKEHANDLKNKTVNDLYKSAAERAGTPYYQARGEAGKPQSFGSPWSADESFPWRKKQSITDYYRRQAEERIKFSLIKKNLNRPTELPKLSIDKMVDTTKSPAPMGRFLRGYKKFLKKNPNFDFDKFYKDAEENLGSVSYAMPKHGADYVFGPEHMRTWKALQKKKDELSLKSSPTLTPDGPVLGPMTKEKEQELVDKTLAPSPPKPDLEPTPSKPAVASATRATYGSAGPEVTVSADKAPPAKSIKKGYKSEDGDWVDGKWYPHH